MGSVVYGIGVYGGRGYALAWWNFVSLIISNKEFFSVWFCSCMLVKVVNVIIFQCVHKFTFCVECSKAVVVSIGPYSCVLCRIWMAYADCGLFDVM
jgi:hypothetical protein